MMILQAPFPLQFSYIKIHQTTPMQQVAKNSKQYLLHELAPIDMWPVLFHPNYALKYQISPCHT